jgi:hypothetical protein
MQGEVESISSFEGELTRLRELALGTLVYGRPQLSLSALAVSFGWKYDGR